MKENLRPSANPDFYYLIKHHEAKKRSMLMIASIQAKKRSMLMIASIQVKRLRQEATARGICATGSKKELIDRLSVANNSEHMFDVEEHKHVDDDKKEKLVTATKKGATVLDQWLADEIKSQYHVLQRGDEIYDAMLNQTNVGDNNNKFYVIQLLESDDGVRYMVYNRWGRVGIKCQDKLYGPYTSIECAIEEFEQKFYAKTKNQWSSRKDFVCYPKCYRWLEMDYTETDNKTDITSCGPWGQTSSISMLRHGSGIWTSLFIMSIKSLLVHFLKITNPQVVFTSKSMMILP